VGASAAARAPRKHGRRGVTGLAGFGVLVFCGCFLIVLNLFFKQPLIFFLYDLDRFSSDFALV
jgi:hypothetical protein